MPPVFFSHEALNMVWDCVCISYDGKMLPDDVCPSLFCAAGVLPPLLWPESESCSAYQQLSRNSKTLSRHVFNVEQMWVFVKCRNVVLAWSVIKQRRAAGQKQSQHIFMWIICLSFYSIFCQTLRDYFWENPWRQYTKGCLRRTQYFRFMLQY